MRILRIL